MPDVRALLDSAVFVYAVGGPHPYRQPCRRIVAALGRGGLTADASVEAVQEFCHQRVRRTGDREATARLARQVSGLCTLHDVTVADLRTALDLFERHPALQVRDALHAATALTRGIAAIVSPDTAFDAVAGLERIDPEAYAADLGSDGFEET